MARLSTFPHSVTHTSIIFFPFFFVLISPPFSQLGPPQAVVDLLVMRELLWSEARSVIFSFMQDCFSSISISAGRHQQQRQDYRMKKRNERDCEARFPLFLSVFFFCCYLKSKSKNLKIGIYTVFLQALPVHSLWSYNQQLVSLAHSSLAREDTAPSQETVVWCHCSKLPKFWKYPIKRKLICPKPVIPTLRRSVVHKILTLVLSI